MNNLSLPLFPTPRRPPVARHLHLPFATCRLAPLNHELLSAFSSWPPLGPAPSSSVCHRPYFPTKFCMFAVLLTSAFSPPLGQNPNFCPTKPCLGTLYFFPVSPHFNLPTQLQHVLQYSFPPPLPMLYVNSPPALTCVAIVPSLVFTTYPGAHSV